MKKLVLAISLASYLVFGASVVALAATRSDNTAGVAAISNSRLAWAVTGTSPRLLFVNEALYPDTIAANNAVTASLGDFGNQERADMAQPGTTSIDIRRVSCEICLT
jgi:hypothetical protein